jgi:hypothetical protein
VKITSGTAPGTVAGWSVSMARSKAAKLPDTSPQTKRWETVRKAVPTCDRTIDSARDSEHIDDRLSLPQPYATLEFTPELRRIVAAWPMLPEVILVGILAMVKAALP